MFCDGDDYYSADMVEQLLNAAQTSGADLAACSIAVFYDDDADTSDQRSFTDKKYYTQKLDGMQQVDVQLLSLIDVSPCNKLYRMRVILERELSFPVGLSYEDYFFVMAYVASASTMVFLKDHWLYHYRRHAGSIMAQTFAKSSRAVDHIRIYVLLAGFLLKWDLLGKSKEFWIDEFRRCADFSIRNSPPSAAPQVMEIANDFFAKDGSALDAVDPSIRARMNGLIDPTVGPGVLRGRRRMAKQIAKSALLHISPTYRKQVQTLEILAALNEIVHTQSVQLQDIERDLKLLTRRFERLEMAVCSAVAPDSALSKSAGSAQ